MKPISFLFLSCLTLLLASCNGTLNQNKDLALQLIPENASSVATLRLPQLMEKADFDNFQKLPIYREFIRKAGEENPVLGKVAESPYESGVDLNQNIYWFSELSVDNPENILIGTLLPLSDANKFESLMAALNDNSIEEKDGYKMLQTSKSTYLLWNKSMALIGNSNHYNRSFNDHLAEILQGKGSSIAGDKNLQKAMNTDHDIASWFSSNALANYRDAQMMLAGMGFDPEALKDNFVHGYLDFEKGAIIGHSDFQMRKALTKDLDLLFKEEIKTDFTPYVPGQDLAMVFSAALDFKGMNQILSERPQTKGFLNYALQSYGLSVDDIAKAMGGDVLLGLYQGSQGEKQEGLFATNIDDFKIFQKFVDFALDKKIIQKLNDDYYAISSGGLDYLAPYSPGPVAFKDKPGFMLIAHRMIFISSNEALLATIKSGGFKPAEQLPSSFKKQMNHQIFNGLLDFAQLEKMGEKIQDIPLKQIEINAGRKAADFKLEMDDQQNNSLQSLLWLLNDLYEKDQLQLDKTEESSI